MDDVWRPGGVLSLFDEGPACLGGCLITFELQHQPPSAAAPLTRRPSRPNTTPTVKRQINSRLTSTIKLSRPRFALSLSLSMSSGGAEKGTGSLVVWSRTMLPRVNAWQTDIMGVGGVGVAAAGRLFPEDVSDCLACWVSALEWRNQVDRKGGS